MVSKKSSKKVQGNKDKIEKKHLEVVLINEDEISDEKLAELKEELKNKPVREVAYIPVESVKPATESAPTPKLQSDAEALRELQLLLEKRPRVPAAITSIRDGAEFVSEYERWNRLANRVSPK